MMNCMNSILLLASLLLATELVVANPIPSQEDNVAPWETVFHKIYDTNPETAHLAPVDTLELLRQLQTLITNDNEIDANEMAFVRDRIQTLIDVSVVNESQCTKEHFEHFSKIFNAHENIYWNILTYLHHFAGSQIALCSPKLDALLVHADDQFSLEELQDVATLVRQTNLHRKLNPASRIDGLLDLMEDKFGPIRGESAYRRDKEKFVELYRSEPEKLCLKVVDYLKPVMSIYSELGVEQAETYEQVNKLTLTWLRNYQVCRGILTDMDALINSPSRALVSLVNKPRRSA